ncbi:MAG: MBL fold metallo-hydrolase [Candidatus Heimdallarchaeaceae archaeon]|jgi:glyoxylase-like metal-dependent hydrolase (beta-lactamase superfamily II)
MVKFEKVSDSVWAHIEGETFGHVAFVKLVDSLVFIDSGYYPNIIKEARKQAEEITGLTVKQLIITHHHGDHVLGNQFFDDCEIISSIPTFEILKAYWTEEKIESLRQREPESFGDLRFVFPNKTFEGEYIIHDENLTLKIIQTNGHTRGSCYIFIPEEEVIIAGDLLFANEIPYFGDDTTDPYKWVGSYKQMIANSPKVIIPGHGPISDIEEIRRQLDYMEKNVKWMENYIEEGGKKKDLDNAEDFPMIDTEPYDNFEMLFNKSKKRTFDVVFERLAKKQ